jgi:hypothetical protein
MPSSWRYLQDLPRTDFHQFIFNLKHPLALENGVVFPRLLVQMQTMGMTIRVNALLSREAQVGQAHTFRMKTCPSNPKQPAVLIPGLHQWDSASPVKSYLSLGFICYRREL